MASKDGFITVNGKRYELTGNIGGGLEGSVYTFKMLTKSGKSVTMCAKIINCANKSDIEKKKIFNHLQWLKKLYSKNGNQAVRRHMAAPLALIDDELGYVMNFASSHEKLAKYMDPPQEDFDSWYTGAYNLKKRYQIMVSLFNALRDIHLAGLIFTDLSPNNIMVKKDENQLVFIDTDNTRRRTDSYSGVLGTPGYMAPELYRNVESLAKEENIGSELLSKCGKITPDSDIFSAAVIAFRLLTLQHPFIGDIIDDGTPEDEERALRIETDYIFKEGTDNISTYGLTTKFNEITTPKIRELFYRTFVDSKANPSLRPTDVEFAEAFREGLDLIEKCPKCGFQKIFNLSDHNECINCGKDLDNRVLIRIYTSFKKNSNIDVINGIGECPEYDLDEESIEKNMDPSYLLSTIVLEEGKENMKVLYGHHFEDTSDRGDPRMAVILSENGEDVEITPLCEEVKKAYCHEGNNGKMVQLGEGKRIRLDRYAVITEIRPFGNGTMMTVCKFERG